MNAHRKRKRLEDGGLHASDDQEWEYRGNQTLPVADLPPGFNGIPLDGAQYLATVRKESGTVPDICYVPNPYAKLDDLPSKSRQSWSQDDRSSDLMPSLEWRKTFLKRFENMRESLANRPQQILANQDNTIPRGRDGKKWYRFLHGRSIPLEVIYDDEDNDDGENGTDEAATLRETDDEVFQCREPSESLLHDFDTSQIISLLGVLPYWLTQPHVAPEDSKSQAIDPFHSRWLFSLLAHLDSHLVGDDISVLRILARACLACIVQSRLMKGPGEQDDNLQYEMGAWMIVCAIAGIWGQHDLWEDGRRDLQECARVLEP